MCKLYAVLAGRVDAYRACVKSGNYRWADNHMTVIEGLVDKFMPSGSGFDIGTSLVLDGSHANRLLFTSSYHHMDEHGGYTHWSAFSVMVTPDLRYGFELSVAGDVEEGDGEPDDLTVEYIEEVFDHALRTDIERTENWIGAENA